MFFYLNLFIIKNDISFDEGDSILINKKNTSIYNLVNITLANYVYLENENIFIISLYNILENGNLYINLSTSKNTLGVDTFVDGIAIQTNEGGEARITQNNQDKITLIAVAYSGYEFSHWETSLYKETILGESINIDIADYNNQVIKAIFIKKSNNIKINNNLNDVLDIY